MVLNHETHPDEGSVLLVAKPKGWTSFDVVNKIRHLLHVKKVGHAGTLDPMATGLLIVCTGRKTREIEQYQGLEKEYVVSIELGARTASYDLETPVIERRDIDHVTETAVRTVLREFEGFQTQLPPMWSAVKVAGKPLYRYARKGREVERKPREIFIRSIVLDNVSLPGVCFTVVCSKGTYIRTLVDDIGRRLGCGAYVTALERVRIGDLLLKDAMTIDELIEGTRQHRIA